MPVIRYHPALRHVDRSDVSPSPKSHIARLAGAPVPSAPRSVGFVQDYTTYQDKEGGKYTYSPSRQRRQVI
jgi:hypothetical protein